MSAGASSQTGPYKGLAPFDDSELDALLFFGREREREIVVANLIASRLTVLYGPSGVGKSSLLGAGVARTLRGLAERPLVVIFSSWAEAPGAGLAAAVCEAAGLPAIGSLRDAVAAVGERDVYLVLDQAEEYFVYHADGDDAFEDDLVHAVTQPLRVNVLLSLREDALAKLDRFKGRIPNLFGNFLRLDRLDRDAGRAAIVNPVGRWNALEGSGVEIEPALVESVLDGVGAGRIEQGLGGVGGGEANGAAGIEAPYLQLVMRRVWEVESGQGSERLRLATLDRLGGAEQIVAELVESAAEALTEEQKDVTAELARFLVTPSGTKIAYSAADLAEYAGVSVEEVETLVQTLVGGRILRPAEGGRYEIYHDVLGAELLAWRARHLGERELERERASSRRRHRRLIVVFGVALIAVAAMAVLSAWALAERRHARGQATRARAGELDANALGLLASDPELGLLLARDAARLAPSTQAENVLRDALRASRLRWIIHAGSPIVAASFDRAGRRMLIASADGKVRLYEASSRKLVRTLEHGAPIHAAAFSSDGSLVVTAGEDGVARIWRADGSLVRTVRHGAPVQAASFSPDGASLVTAGGHAAKLWRVRAGGLAAVVRTPSPVVGASFGPGGKLVVVIARDHLARVFRVGDPGQVQTFDQGGLVTGAAISPVGFMLVTAGANRTARLWSLRTGKLLAELTGHEGPVWAASFSPLARRVATASQDGTARVWTLTRAGGVSAVVPLVGHTNPVLAVAFSDDGQYVVTASEDGTAQVWTSETGSKRALLAGDTGPVRSAVFSPDGRFVLTGSDDGTARLWESGAIPELTPTALQPPSPPAGTARSSDGTTATAHGDVVDLSGPDGDHVLKGHTDRVDSVAFNPDGTQLVTASRDHDARVWDVATGRLLHRLHAHFGGVVDARFSPDGRWIVTAGPTTVGLWAAPTGEFVGYLRGPTSLLTAVAFAADSRTIVTSERDGPVRRYVCDVCGTLDELLQLAGARLAATGRVLTPEERARYGG